jgi:hypothetical protein
MGFPGRSWLFLVPFLLACVPSSSHAQEIEPRKYVNTPVGVNFLGVGYALSSGNVLLDPSLPIEDLDADLHVLLARYVRSVDLAGRPSMVAVLVPWSSGDWTGIVEGEARARDVQGMGDLRFSFNSVVWGAESLRKSEFAEYDPSPLFAVSLDVIAPTGQYDPSRLVNLGSNRWAFHLEVGTAFPGGKWSFEFAVGVWLFTDNDDFFGGSRLDQDPLYVIKAHAIRTFRPGMWLGFGVGYGEGGRTKLDGVPRATLQQNWRFGVRFTYPLSPSQGLALTLYSGVNRGAGSDFNGIAISYQVAWGGR